MTFLSIPKAEVRNILMLFDKFYIFYGNTNLL